MIYLLALILLTGCANIENIEKSMDGIKSSIYKKLNKNNKSPSKNSSKGIAKGSSNSNSKNSNSSKNEFNKSSLHIVKVGENLTSISNLYGVLSRDVISVNKLSYPYILNIGDELVIPEVKKNNIQKQKVEEQEVKVFEKVKIDNLKDIFPWNEQKNFSTKLALGFRSNMSKISGLVSKNYVDVLDVSQKSDGIFIKFLPKDDLNNHVSEKIYVNSITSGKIVLISNTEDFGKIVIVDAGDNKFVIYAYLSSVSVKKDQFINGGDKIGFVLPSVFKNHMLFLGIYRIEKGERVFVDPLVHFSYLRRFFS
jgi:hypothetical protein